MNKIALTVIFIYFWLSANSTEPVSINSRDFMMAGKDHFLADRYNMAIKSLNLALDRLYSDPVKRNTELLQCRAYLANAYWYNGNTTEADEMIKVCETGLNEISYSPDARLIEVCMLMAEYYLNAGYPDELSDRSIDLAVEFLNKVMPGDPALTGILYYLKGHSKYLKRDFENSVQYFNQSAEYLRKFPSLVRYECFNYIYLTYIFSSIEKENKKAIEFGNAVLERQDLPQETRSMIYYLTGLAFKELEDTASVLDYCRKAIISASSLSSTVNKSVLYRAYHQLAIINKKNRKVYLDYLNKALEQALLISEKNKDVIFIYYRLAHFYYSEKNYNEALYLLQKALINGSDTFDDLSFLSNPTLDAIKPYQYMVNILALKANALIRINISNMAYVETALQCTELASEMLEKKLNDVELENSGLMIAESSQRIFNNAVIYSTLLYQNKGIKEYAERAFYYSEKGKMQVLRMNTARPEILKKSGVPDSTILKSIDLANEILGVENRMALHTSTNRDELASRLSDRLTYLYDQRDLLNNYILQSYPEYNRRRYDVKVPGINEIRSVIQSDQALIEYQLTSKQLITFVITKDQFEVYSQWITNQTKEHIEIIRRLISENPIVNYTDSNFSCFINSSHLLYNVLIAPVYENIKGKRLIIIPHDKLSLIPFEVLIRKNYTGRPDYRNLDWLIREFPVIYAFSANFLFEDPEKKYDRRTAIFVPGYYSANDNNRDYLEGTVEEAEYLRKAIHGKVFSNEKANEANFKRESPLYGMIHLASHTKVNDRRPDLSYFIMNATTSDETNDGKLYAFEIKQLKLNAKLAVLSGCNTGFGRLRLSEGFISLARSFYYAGIRTVAFTLWSVADVSSAEIMKKFYKEIDDGQTLDRAMMKSKVSFISDADPVKAHPYYWAGFIISGKADAVINKKLLGHTGIWLIILLTLTTGLVAFKKIIG
jgi:CHAT domain-containing protein